METSVQDIMFVIDNYVYHGLGNIAALDTAHILEISLLLAQMFIGVCRQLTRLTHVLPTIESVPLGWLCANRYCRVLCPDGLQGACGLSAHGFLRLLDIGRSAIRLNVNAGELPLPVRLDLSSLIYDSGLELRQVFTTGVSIVAFNPTDPVENEALAEMYCCIALPASIADSLANGFPTAIPFPLGQLNICLNIESALRKMSRWHRQGCLGNLHCREDTTILVFRPLRNHLATELRRPNGRGGYVNFHNCAFIGSSWCLTIDSSDDLTWTLPRPCQSTAIVLRLERLSVRAMTNIVRIASFAHWLPGESIHRHCAFPLSMNQVDGLPELALLNDDLQEIDHQSIEEHVSDTLNDEEYRILIGAASAIERKRKSAAATSIDQRDL